MPGQQLLCPGRWRRKQAWPPPEADAYQGGRAAPFQVWPGSSTVAISIAVTIAVPVAITTTAFGLAWFSSSILSGTVSMVASAC